MEEMKFAVSFSLIISLIIISLLFINYYLWLMRSDDGNMQTD